MFIASSTILDIINKYERRLSYRSDDSIIELEILLNKFNHGKGVWKFNNSLLENTKYLNLINKTRLRTHLWPDAGCIHRQRPTNIV